MSFKVSFENEEGDERSALVIEIDGKVERHWDGGEPEDNYYFRDWSWIRGALQRAYEVGKRDGATNKVEE